LLLSNQKHIFIHSAHVTSSCIAPPHHHSLLSGQTW